MTETILAALAGRATGRGGRRWPRSPRWTRSGWTARSSPGPTPRSTCSRTRCTTARGSSRASAPTRRSAASAVLRLTEHLKRLVRSAKLYYMPVPYTRRAALRRHVRGARVQQARRLLHPPAGLPRLRRDGPVPDERAGATSIIAAWPWGTYLGDEGIKHGVRAKTSSIQSLDHTALARAAKATGQYLNSILAKVEVLNAGYDEAVMLTEHGHVAEGSGENIFCVRNGVLMTPPPSDGVLEGITRDIVHAAGRRARASSCRSARSRAATSSSPTSSSTPAPRPRSCRSARSTTTSSASPAPSRAACRSASRPSPRARDEEFGHYMEYARK